MQRWMAKEWITGSDDPIYYCYNVHLSWLHILMPTRHSLIQPQDVLIILDFVLPGVYLGFKESKLPDSLHRIERGKKVVKSLSETIGKKVYGECLSLQILLNNATTNAIQAGGRKEKQSIFSNTVVILSSSKIQLLLVKRGQILNFPASVHNLFHPFIIKDLC